VIISFRGMGVGSKAPRILKSDIFPSIFAKKVVFLVSSGEKVILPLLAIPTNYFWSTPGNSTIGPSLKKILPASMFRGTCSSIKMMKGYMARESLENP